MAERKYGRPKKRILNLDSVSNFLVSINFEVESIAQEWRHLHAFGKYQGKNAVFKLASTQETSPRTQNEYKFNEAVHLTPESVRPNFTVPENYSSGNYGKLFYFIAERFMGEPLVARNSVDLEKIKSHIPQIAQATYELQNLPIPKDCAFAQSKKARQQKEVSIGERLLESSTEWAAQVSLNLDSFLEVIQKSKDTLRTSVGHGDFVPRQLYDVKGKIGIIDGEHAGLKGPLYYDVAQFYIRLRNDHNGAELAKKYLSYFKKLLTQPDQNTFWGELKPILIQRYIGDLWGAAKKPERLTELKPLGIEILEDKIL